MLLASTQKAKQNNNNLGIKQNKNYTPSLRTAKKKKKKKKNLK